MSPPQLAEVLPCVYISERMDPMEKGTWIVNSTKHLQGVVETSPERAYLEATELAGKTGLLLSRLVADQTEVVDGEKVRAFARESGVTRWELAKSLEHLKAVGKVDYTADKQGHAKAVEIYCFSAGDALKAVAEVYQSMDPSEYDEANLASLARTFTLPRTHEELVEALTNSGFPERVSETTLELQDALGLVKVTGEAKPSDKLYFNEYAFAGDPNRIVRALRSLSNNDRVAVQDAQQLIAENPGYSLEHLEKHLPRHVVKMMEGVGLVDAVTVNSDIGEATFATLPQLKGISIDVPALSADVFHKAKVLLASLRFGEVKSYGWRGRIGTREKMINIVNKLIRGDWVGPCTAIGHDYQLLERDGVVETRPAGGGMYTMKLRQREVGLVVRQILELGRAVPEADLELQKLLMTQPSHYKTPEQRRLELLAKVSKPVDELRQRFLLSIRTGARA